MGSHFHKLIQSILVPRGERGQRLFAGLPSQQAAADTFGLFCSHVVHCIVNNFPSSCVDKFKFATLDMGCDWLPFITKFIVTDIYRGKLEAKEHSAKSSKNSMQLSRIKIIKIISSSVAMQETPQMF